MSRTRLISLGVLVVVALSAIVLAPAMAEPKKCGVPSPTHWAFCYGSGNEEMTLQKVDGSGGAASLTVMFGSEAKFECESNTVVAELEASGKGGGKITLHKCKETTPEHCKLTTAEEKEIELPFGESLTGKLESPGKPKTVLAGGQPGEEFASIGIEDATSACTIPAERYKVTGQQNAELPSAGESLVEHEIVAKKSLSNLKVGGNEASLSATAKIKLLSPHEGSTWYVGLGN